MAPLQRFVRLIVSKVDCFDYVNISNNLMSMETKGISNRVAETFNNIDSDLQIQNMISVNGIIAKIKISRIGLCIFFNKS